MVQVWEHKREDREIVAEKQASWHQLFMKEDVSTETKKVIRSNTLPTLLSASQNGMQLCSLEQALWKWAMLEEHVICQNWMDKVEVYGSFGIAVTAC